MTKEILSFKDLSGYRSDQLLHLLEAMSLEDMQNTANTLLLELSQYRDGVVKDAKLADLPENDRRHGQRIMLETRVNTQHHIKMLFDAKNGKIPSKAESLAQEKRNNTLILSATMNGQVKGIYLMKNGDGYRAINPNDITQKLTQGIDYKNPAYVDQLSMDARYLSMGFRFLGWSKLKEVVASGQINDPLLVTAIVEHLVRAKFQDDIKAPEPSATSGSIDMGDKNGVTISEDGTITITELLPAKQMKSNLRFNFRDFEVMIAAKKHLNGLGHVLTPEVITEVVTQAFSAQPGSKLASQAADLLKVA